MQTAPNRPKSKLEAAKCYRTMRRWICQGNVSCRFFFIEDMSPSVVEILGSTYRCNPQLFLNHMKSLDKAYIASYDDRGVMRSWFFPDANPHTSQLRGTSAVQHDCHFSLPFLRKLGKEHPRRFQGGTAQSNEKCSSMLMFCTNSHCWTNC